MLAANECPLPVPRYFLCPARCRASAMMHRWKVRLRPSRELKPSSMLQLMEQWSKMTWSQPRAPDPSCVTPDADPPRLAAAHAAAMDLVHAPPVGVAGVEVQGHRREGRLLPLAAERRQLPRGLRDGRGVGADVDVVGRRPRGRAPRKDRVLR